MVLSGATLARRTSIPLWIICSESESADGRPPTRSHPRYCSMPLRNHDNRLPPPGDDRRIVRNPTAGDSPCSLPTPSLRSPPTSPLSTSSRTPPTLLSGAVHRLDHAPDDHRIG